MLSASVVVSCYNQDLYIEECLDSILAQEINFQCEIIVSDDCSSDDTQLLLVKYKELYPDKITILLRTENVGAALNYHGVHAMAKGDIVFHFDGDDVMLPGKLQEQYDVFSQHKDVNIVFHKAIYFSDDRKYMSETQYPHPSKPSPLFFSLADLSRWGTTAVHSSYAYRRTSRQAKIDREFMEWYFAMDSLIPAGRGAYINRPLVMYRCNVGGGSYLSTKAGKKKSYNIYLKDLYFYFDQNSKLRSDLYSNFLVTFLAMIKSTKTASIMDVCFLVRNVFYFRYKSFIEAISVRKLVGPKKKVR